MARCQAGDAPRRGEAHEALKSRPFRSSVKDRSEAALGFILFRVLRFGGGAPRATLLAPMQSGDTGRIREDRSLGNEETRSAIGEFGTRREGERDITQSLPRGSLEDRRGHPNLDPGTHGSSLGKGLSGVHGMRSGFGGDGENLRARPGAAGDREGKADQLRARTKLCMKRQVGDQQAGDAHD